MKIAWLSGVLGVLLGAAPVLAAPPGSIVILGAPVDPKSDNFDKAVKAAAVTALPRVSEGWHLSFVAYLRKPPGIDEVTVALYDIPPKHEPVNTYKIHTQATVKVLMAELDLRLDDGLKPGTKYLMRVTRLANGKEEVFASAPLELK